MNAFTKGIRKIFTVQVTVGMNFDKACSLAQECGYNALSYNGTIFVYNRDKGPIFVETPFTIDDFNLN